MERMTKTEIQQLLKKTGHVLAVADFDDFDELDDLAKGFLGVSKRERRILSSPIDLCGVKFFPLTVAKSTWYAEKVRDWEVCGTDQDGLLFWLLSLPLTEEALEKYSEQKAANKAAKKLSRKLHCAPQELTDVYIKCLGSTAKDIDSEADFVINAVDRVIESLKKEDDSKSEIAIRILAKKMKPSDPDAVSYGGTIAALIREYGQSPSYWLHEPIERISMLFEEIENRVMREESVSRGAAAKGGKAVAPTPNRKHDALAKYQKKLSQIELKWMAENGD